MEHPTSEDVDVQMVHGLACPRAVIDDRAVAPVFQPSFACQARCQGEEASEQGLIAFACSFKRGQMSSRNHQEVNGRLGVHILDRYRDFVLEHDSGRGLVANDPAEDAVFHWVLGR
jgi:hypothetical protein